MSRQDHDRVAEDQAVISAVTSKTATDDQNRNDLSHTVRLRVDDIKARKDST